MGTTGIKRNSLKQQRVNGELELVIDEFAQAMRNADRNYVVREGEYYHENVRFTLNMQMAWYRYVDFCQRNPE